MYYTEMEFLQNKYNIRNITIYIKFLIKLLIILLFIITKALSFNKKQLLLYIIFFKTLHFQGTNN